MFSLHSHENDRGLHEIAFSENFARLKIHEVPRLMNVIHKEQPVYATDKKEFIKTLRQFSAHYKEGLPEERTGMAYFKGNAKCITCHNSLYIKRTSVYISKLMEFNRSGSKIKIDQELKKVEKDASLKNQVNENLIEYIKDESDIKWSSATAIPSA